jgi:diguanylate cyclase (GGDEF)-like protein/PAS domain S-box-containing protein
MEADSREAALADEVVGLRARLAQLTTALEHMHQGLCMYDADGRLLFGNTAYALALGLDPEELRPGMTSREVIESMRARGHSSDRSIDEVVERLRSQLGWGPDAGEMAPERGEANLVRGNGQTFAIRHQRTGEGDWVATFADITQALEIQRRAEAALKESEERFRLAAEAAGLGVWDYDTTLERRNWSDRLREIFGFSQEAEASLEAALGQVHAEDRIPFLRQLQRIRDEQECNRFEASLRIERALDGENRWICVNGWKTVKADCPMGRIIMTVRDVTDEKRAEERIVWSASHDPLTGLANRSYFNAKLQMALAAAGEQREGVGLLLLDIDRFKQINDTLGHDAGDRLLETFAARLRACTRVEDTVARLGGDEFAIILGCVSSRQDVAALARSILQRLCKPFSHNGAVLDCRASIGAALYPVHGRTATELMKHADLALYASKAGGRCMSTLFDPAMKTKALRSSAMLQRARSALEDDRLFAYYQPKVDLRRGAVIGLEALLRWRSPQGRIGGPAALGPAFEDLELATAISNRIIGQVVADIGTWLADGVPFGHVAVNASAAEFRRDDFAERVLERLARAGIATRHLELEVTETVFVGRGADHVHRAIDLLSREGVRIALDDFGTGYASLRHLKQFRVDTIKIDCSFVRDMEEDAGDEAIIRAVINLGRALGIKVVAEGIERRSQAERLLRLDCQFGQGFLFSKAIPPARVPALLTRPRLMVLEPEPQRMPAGLRLAS